MGYLRGVNEALRDRASETRPSSSPPGGGQTRVQLRLLLLKAARGEPPDRGLGPLHGVADVTALAWAGRINLTNSLYVLATGNDIITRDPVTPFHHRKVRLVTRHSRNRYLFVLGISRHRLSPSPSLFESFHRHLKGARVCDYGCYLRARPRYPPPKTTTIISCPATSLPMAAAARATWPLPPSRPRSLRPTSRRPL